MDKIEYIKRSEIVIEENYNVRKIGNTPSFKDFLKLVEATGKIETPLVCQKAKDGTITLRQGHRRVLAAEMLAKKGKKTFDVLPVIFREFSEKQALIDLFTSNSGKTLNLLEQGRGFLKMEAAGMSRKDIAEKTAKTQAHISNGVKLANLSEEIQALIDGEKISASLVLSECQNEPDEKKLLAKLNRAIETANKSGKSKVTKKTVKKANGKADDGEDEGKNNDAVIVATLTQEQKEELASAFEELSDTFGSYNATLGKLIMRYGTELCGRIGVAVKA